MNLISRDDIPWALAFAKKVLVFFAIVNVGVLPIILILRIDLRAYFFVILYEGFCLVILGCSLLFLSLFSTVERDDYRYLGKGFTRRDTVVRALRSGEKRLMRLRGVIMITFGLLFWVVNL